MSDDWRVRAELQDPAGAPQVLRGIKEWGLASDVEATLPERLPVSAGESHVFVYAASRDQAERAGATVRQVIAAADLQGEVTVDRWHPEAEEWQDADAALPQTAAEHDAEHARREAREAHASAARGPQWELRIDCVARHDAVELSAMLEREGVAALRRWRHVFILAATDDEAQAHAGRLRSQLPVGAVMTVEGSAAGPWNATHRFAVLGGLAG